MRGDGTGRGEQDRRAQRLRFLLAIQSHPLLICREGGRPGGLGLAMVQAMADEMLYNEKQNEVVLVKYLA